MKKKKIGIIIAVVAAVLVIFYVIGVATGIAKPASDPSTGISSSDSVSSGTEASSSGTDETSESSSEAENTTEAYSATLTAGHYTAGIDFPAGRYDLTALSGTGNVSSSNMYSGGLNEIMGISDNDMYQESFSGASLDKGVVLNIGGTLELQLDCSAAMTGDMQARQNPATQEYTFSAGNYVCGTDFEPGEYVITAVSGSGNVSSDNMYSGGLNEIMGVEADDIHISTFNNATFESGNSLTISGVTIKLTPSK